jgi:guanylate kinase
MTVTLFRSPLPRKRLLADYKPAEAQCKVMKKASYKIEAPFNLPSKPLLIVLSGPSGVGKDTILSRMEKSAYPIEFITTLTTRSQRAREKDKVDYHFISEEGFQEMIKNKKLLEWANVYGNWYGVPKAPVKRALDEGRDVIVKVDIQGAATIKKVLPQAVFIFVAPSSREDLEKRLSQRHTESPIDLALRLKTAEEEMKKLPLFDYIVVNRQAEIERAVAEIEAIITAEKHRVKPREIRL